MWLFTTVGFFSAVRKPGDTELTVRARARRDLDALRATYLPELGPTVAHAGTDYPYRARVPHEAFARALAAVAREIDYDNFKDAVADRQGYARAHAYAKVWQVLLGLERDDA